MSTSDSAWADFRRQMPVAGRYAYFDHAAVSPLTAAAQAAVVRWADEAAGGGEANWPRWVVKLDALRNTAARMINAGADEIALVANTTTAISYVAEGFPWREGDNVVVPRSEFPSNMYPWLNLAPRGVEVRRVPTQGERLNLDDVVAACDSRTRLIAVSWVGYQTGWRNDLARLAEIAHGRGASLLVDAIQGLGVLALDVGAVPIDFLAADGHKWMLGPEGAGIMYIRRARLDALRPIGVGWNSVPQTGDFTKNAFQLRDSASRYEGGSQNMPGLLALGASLDLLTSWGAERLEARLLDYGERVCAALRSLGATIASAREPHRGSGIIACELPGQDPLAVKRRCLARDVVLNARAGRIRISPHVYNDQSDLDRLVDALRSA